VGRHEERKKERKEEEIWKGRDNQGVRDSGKLVRGSLPLGSLVKKCLGDLMVKS
jgi:hypothetical protein